LIIVEKYYAIAVCKNLDICTKKSVIAPIVEVSKSVCLDIKTNKAKKFISKYLKKKYLITEKEVFYIKSYWWLSDGNINSYIAAFINKANDGYNFDLYIKEVKQKVSYNLQL
jgi:hypothetical protein